MTDAPPQPAPNPSLFDLFTGFLWASLRGFGGVFVMGRRMMVEERRWLTPDEFVETLGLCQFLPGANIVNMSVAVGGRFRGPAGALAALSGILIGPALIAVGLTAVYMRFSALPQVAHAMAAVAAAAAGLVVGIAVKMAGAELAKDALSFLPVALAALVAIALLHWPLPLVLAVVAPVSIALAWVRRRTRV